jgi:hypothetical protein
MGTVPATVNGISKIIRNDFPSIVDHLVVYGSHTLLTRAADDAGAVDVYVQGVVDTQRVENYTFIGVGQHIDLTNQPVSYVSTVVAGVVTFVEGVDYDLIPDTSGVAGSDRATSYVVFLPGAATLPAIGDLVTITYTQNSLVSGIQDEWLRTDRIVPGQDVLFRQATQKDVVLTADLVVSSGFNTLTIQTAASDALIAYADTLRLGDDVEESDLQAVVRRISGVDNFVINELYFSGDVVSVGDLAVLDSEYARMSAADMSITVI